MALNIQLERDGELVPLNWGWWNVQMLRLALSEEGKPTTDYEQTLDEHHTYEDTADGEILCLQPGDLIRQWG